MKFYTQVLILFMVQSVGLQAAETVSQEQRNQQLLYAVDRGDVTAVTELLEQGANVNCQDRDGWTMVHASMVQSCPTVLQRLLDAGACIHTKTNSGHTPLYVAMNSSRASEAHIAVLLQVDPDTTYVNCYGNTGMCLDQRLDPHNVQPKMQLLLGSVASDATHGLPA